MYYFVYVWENILSQRYRSVYCRCVNVQNMGLLLTHTLMCVYNSAANVYVVYVWKSLTSRRYSSVNCQCVYELWYMHNAEILFCQLSMCQCTYYGPHTNNILVYVSMGYGTYTTQRYYSVNCLCVNVHIMGPILIIY